MIPVNKKKCFFEKCLLAVAFFFLCVNHSLLYANTNETIEQLTQEVASKSNKVIRKQLPEGAKIALCLFMGSNLKNEPIKTTLGIKITEAFYHQLILKTKKEYTVIFPDGLSNKVLSDASGKYFEPPKNAEDEAKFWQSYLDGQKPEYYITGQYLLEKNRVTLKNIFISSDIYSKAPIKFTIENVDFEIDQSTYNELDLIDREIKPFSDPIMELLNLKSRGNFFEYQFLKGKEIKSNTEAFLINNEYNIELNIKKKTFLYAVFYQENDPETKEPILIYPEPNAKTGLTQSNFQTSLNIGKITIPEQWSIGITPPAGNFMILLLATGQESISFRTENTKDEQNSVVSKLSLEKSKAFLSTLKALNPEDFQMVVYKGVIKE
jgi:predicted CopG family antitoxin